MTEFQSQILMTDDDINHYFFTQDDTHFSHPLTPLFASYMIPALIAGTRKAFSSLKSPMTMFLAKLKDYYFYQAVVPYPGDPKARMAEHQRTLEARLDGQMDEFWKTVEGTLLPLYQELDQRVAAGVRRETAPAVLDRIMEVYETVWAIHFEVVFPRMHLARVLLALHEEITGEDDPASVYSMMAGLMNKSLETDRQIWLLAQRVKNVPDLSLLLEKAMGADDWAAVLRQTAVGQRFLPPLQAFLQEYGHRCSHSHEFSEPTWIENPRPVLTMIRQYVQRDHDFDAGFAATVRQREEAVTQFMNRWAGHPALDKFAQTHQDALKAWSIDEDHHFYIDAMLPARTRPLLLKVGDLLVAAGQLETREDVFYLYLDELQQALGSADTHWQAIVQSRRAEYVAATQRVPEPHYGQPPEQHDEDKVMAHVFGVEPEPVDERRQIISGSAASAGIHTGVVKVVSGHEEFAKVSPGNVLVCRTTTPTWTTLFSVVGAIVTDAGGILSHAATVAREYRVPCVVGTKVATSRLVDGDTVTVNGAEGTVTLVRRA